MSDHYHILGLKPGATPQAVKAAYRRLALKYHPDRNPDPTASQQFVRIKRAYEVLSNPQKYSTHSRKAYTGPSASAPPKPSADQRKYGTRHKFTNPPPTKAEQDLRYNLILQEYALFTKKGMKLPRHIWRKRFSELWRESLHNYRWFIALIFTMAALSVFAFLYKEESMGAIMIAMSLSATYDLVSEKAPGSLAGRKSKISP